MPDGAQVVDWLARTFGADVLAEAARRARELQGAGPMRLPAAPAVRSPLGATVSRPAEWALVPPAQLAAQAEAADLLRDRVVQAGAMVLGNHGAGQNLCVLMAMLQATGMDSEPVQAEAIALRDRLSQRADRLGAALRQQQGLYSDRDIFQALADEVYGGHLAPPMFILRAGAGGEMHLQALTGDVDAAVGPEDVPHHAAVFLESPGHLRAVANVSGRPWSVVLAEAAGRPAPGRHGARALQWRARLPDGREGPLPAWSRGAQAALVPLQLGQDGLDRSPAWMARAMAAAQSVVDDFWTAAERGVVAHLGTTEAAGGASIHRLRPAREHDGQARFEALLHIHQNHLLGITVQGTGAGDIAVEYEHLWQREAAHLMSQRASQARLNAALRAHPVPPQGSDMAHAQRLFDYEPSLTDADLAAATGLDPGRIAQELLIRPPGP